MKGYALNYSWDVLKWLYNHKHRQNKPFYNFGFAVWSYATYPELALFTVQILIKLICSKKILVILLKMYPSYLSNDRWVLSSPLRPEWALTQWDQLFSPQPTSSLHFPRAEGLRTWPCHWMRWTASGLSTVSGLRSGWDGDVGKLENAVSDSRTVCRIINDTLTHTHWHCCYCLSCFSYLKHFLKGGGFCKVGWLVQGIVTRARSHYFIGKSLVTRTNTRSRQRYRPFVSKFSIRKSLLNYSWPGALSPDKSTTMSAMLPRSAKPSPETFP